MSSWVWRVYLPLALVAAVVAVLGFSDAPFAYPAAGAVGLVGVGLALARRRGDVALRRSWSLIGLGIGGWVAGDTIWDYYGHVLLTDPFPSIADVVYLAAYPVLAMGLLQRVRQRTGGADRASLIDATIIATGTAVLAWVFLMAPYATDPGLTTTERLISLAYPMGDVLLVAMAARLVFAPGRLATADVLLVLALLSVLVADTLFGYAELTTGFVGGGVADMGWLVGYILVGAAALHPSGWARDASAGSGAPRLPQGRIVLLAAASLLAPALLGVQSVRSEELNLLVIAGGSAALFLLVLVRMEGLVRQVQRQATELERLATTDGLTGLANRRQWDVELPRAVARARREGSPLCVAVLDLDHFKRFNDERGHLAGDDLLRETARTWAAHLRPDDLLARYGGEEFALLLPGCGPREAVDLLERLCAAPPLGQTCSAGVAAWNGGESPALLTARADAALYQAKRAGRARVVTAEVAIVPG